MHKNIPVIDIAIDEDSGLIKSIGQVHNLAHLPVGTKGLIGADKGKPERKKLNDWWASRSIPASRENIQTALYQMNLLQATELLSKCYGLSLSDQYWIKQVNSELEWANINFFENSFSRDVGNILFGHEPDDSERLNFMSPDNTSDGWLRKKWVILDNKRFLMKGGSGPYQQEPFNELIACALMKRLEISHVPYTLTASENLPFSLCETFITPQTELIPAWRVIQTLRRDNRDSEYSHLLSSAETLNIPSVVPALEKMLVLDYIIANTDRHYNNFGFVRDAETLEWHGVAPIYDSGTSLWHDMQFVGRLPKSRPFRKTHAEQIKLVKDFSWFDYGALGGFEIECNEILLQSEFIDENRRNAIIKAIKTRIEEVMKFV